MYVIFIDHHLEEKEGRKGSQIFAIVLKLFTKVRAWSGPKWLVQTKKNFRAGHPRVNLTPFQGQTIVACPITTVRILTPGAKNVSYFSVSQTRCRVNIKKKYR